MPISGTWIAFDKHSNFAFEKAVFVGKDKNGHSMFIGRAKYENDLLPGKFVLEQRACFVPYGGGEVRLESCEILINDNYGWTASSIGDILQNAVIGGETASFENLYIGRVSHEGIVTPGKIHPSHKTMYVSSDNGEHRHNTYEILVSGSQSFPMEVTTKTSQVQVTSTFIPTPNAPESSFVPVPGLNVSSAASVANASSDIGWMVSSESTPQHPNIPAEKLITCQKCGVQRIEGVFVPCGHCVCVKCGNALSPCFKCGQQVEKVQRIYFA